MSDKSKNAQFLRLYSAEQNKLYAFILATVHNRNAADEIFQETTIVLWENFEKFVPGSSFGAWAIGIARNKVFEYIRKYKKTRMIFSSDFYESICDYAEEASKNNIIDDRMELLEVCLGKLQDRDRKLLKMRFNKNLSMHTISQQTGRSHIGLYKTMSRIITQLRACINRQTAIRET